MAGCGYVCPLCEGTGYGNDAIPCSYCFDGSTGVSMENEVKDRIEKLQDEPCFLNPNRTEN